MIPYAQRIISDYLRDEVDTRVVSTPPDGNARQSAWVMVTQLGAPQDPASRHDHLVEFYFQIDCYAGATGGLPEAIGLGRATRAALAEMPNSDHDDAVVTATRIRGDRSLPDTAMEPSRNRVILTVSCWMHAVAVAS